MKTLLIILAVLFIFMMFLIRSKPYTNQEWEDKMASDFKKYGPVPDDIDEVKELKKGDLVYLNYHAKVEVSWCNDELMQVIYSDLTSQLLKQKDYKITYAE